MIIGILIAMNLKAHSTFYLHSNRKIIMYDVCSQLHCIQAVYRFKNTNLSIIM